MVDYAARQLPTSSTRASFAAEDVIGRSDTGLNQAFSGGSSGGTWIDDFWRNLAGLDSSRFSYVVETASLDGFRQFLAQAPGGLKRPLLYH